MNTFRFIKAAPLLFVLATGISPVAKAGFTGSISFTDDERKQHEEGQDLILKTAAQCLENDIAHHLSFFKATGISPYYGDRSAFGKLSHAGKKNFLRSIGKNPSLVDKLEPTSCVGLMLKCLGKGFKEAKQDAIWDRLRKFTMINGVDGTAMQHGLRELGWKVLYWNPDVRLNREWDRAERNKNPSNSDRFWGYHESNWVSVKGGGKYLYNKIDDVRLLVNFGNAVPEAIKNVPFWVGTAHGGYHVFPGMGGRIVEAHSTRKINDIRTLEADHFNPLNNEAPTGGMYKTGMIAVPAKFVK